MKNASPQMIALLDSNQFIMADLYTITLHDGSVLKYTGADRDIEFGEFGTFKAGSMLLRRGQINSVIGVEVDTLTITMLTTPDTTVDGTPISSGGVPATTYAQNGGFDGAEVLLRRTVMETWGDTSAGALILFKGRVGPITIEANKIILPVLSDLELLNVNLPRNIYQAGCIHTLYDSGCTVNAEAFTSTYTSSGSTRFVIGSESEDEDGYFNMGTLKFLDGLNAGVMRSVKIFSAGEFTVSFPFPYEPEDGDTFEVKPGCDKRKTTCNEKFGNVINFRAFPYIPVPEASY